MKTPETEAPTSRAGQDPVITYMKKMGGPLTLETYMALSYPGQTLKDLDAESLSMIPEELQGQLPSSARVEAPTSKLPAAPTRNQFQTTDEFEEALGHWQSHVGRIKAMADLATRSKASTPAHGSTAAK